MNKRVFFLVTSLFISANSFATTSPFDGVYGGLSVGGVYGYFSQSGNAELNLGSGPLATTFQAPFDTHTSNIALFGGGQAGFGHVFNRVYLGMEANGDLGTVNNVNYPELTDSTSDLTANVKNTSSIQNNYGVTFRPGFLITPTLMVYGQAGVEWAQIDFNSTATFGNIPGTNQIYSISSASDSNQMGYRLGVGLEKKTTKHLSMHVEYDFTAFHSIDVSNQTAIAGGLPGSNNNMTQSATLTPYMHSVMIGVNYYV